VIRICSKCGALLLDDTEGCSFCEVEASEKKDILEPVAAGVHSASASSAAKESDWRGEVSRRLEQYRARRGRPRPNDPQSGLPFQEISLVEEDFRERQLGPSAAELNARSAPRSRKTERVEIRIQPELDFSSASSYRSHPQSALVPVATLAERRWAGLIDLIFLGFTCVGFLGLFRSLGGEIVAGKIDTIVYLVVAYLFYTLYVSLFTTLAGSTPGMQLRGLTIVRLDGSLPDTSQLLWRSFGYMLSAAALLLGFLWALWDEDRFTWQDRISQTYVTAAMPVSELDSLDARAH
jgi:uncharacterized RDD family membrane protein YckC